MVTTQYRPFTPAVLANPYPVYHRLRAEDPVHWSEPTGGWVLTRYHDVALALSDRRFSAADRPPMRRDGPVTTMVTADPPEHTRLRRLVSKAFTAKAVEAMRPRIRQIVDGLLDEGEGQRMDVVQDFAYPLPVTVIAEMLGVPVADRDKFKRWASQGLAGIVGRLASAEDRARAQRGGEELRSYFTDAIARRRRDPGDDLISALIAAEDEGSAPSEAEVLDNCTLLITAGHETTSSLIGNSMLALLRNPDQLRRLQDDPSLIETAVEELLRYDPPVQAVTRRTLEDVEIDGRTIEAGRVVFAVVGTANRDPARFQRPDQLDIGRPDNPHIAFGDGRHFCLGAPLARAEAQIGIAALVRRFSQMRLAGPEQWGGNFIVRGATSLPVALQPE
jgi:pimeloyl-[acyl-carrier protein] synthase